MAKTQRAAKAPESTPEPVTAKIEDTPAVPADAAPPNDDAEAPGGDIGDIETAEDVPAAQLPDTQLLDAHPFRPSDLSKVMRQEKAVGDPFRFAREHGLPTARRRYRVTAKGRVGGQDITPKPAQVDATDESEAIQRFADARRIKAADRHRFRFQVVVLAE